MGLQSKTKARLYGNCVMLSPDNHVMCRCDEKKAIWYLSRGLARLIVDDPLVFQLTFKPQNLGNHGNTKYNFYYLASKKNRCCVCGRKKHLTKHHCVPLFYRKHLPDNIKSHNSHDVFLLCVDHHHEYERIADKFRTELAKEVGIPIHVTKKKEEKPKYGHIRGLCWALIKDGDKIPADRKASMIAKINEHLGKEATQEEIVALAVPRKESRLYKHVSDHGKMVVEQFAPEEFVKRWRRHFIETMKPKYMPTYWDVDNPIENCSEV